MKVVIIIIDGLGCGALPDTDEDANTICHIAEKINGLELPNLQKLGLGNIIKIKGIPQEKNPIGCFGKAKEKSPGKDTITGHWEITGVIIKEPLPTFPNGIPKEMIKKFESAINKKTLGGYPASGTEIIKELGEEHIKTGFPIIYTSADSVFQIACHKEVIPLDELYKMCLIARNLFPNIGRIIARPFIGEKGNFIRTHERKDFSLPPPDETLFDLLQKKGIPVITIGKIDYIFAGRGITKSIHTKDNNDCMSKIMQEIGSDNSLIFANLVDFDMLWGHRQDVIGFANGLKEFDSWLPLLLENLASDDVLFITADHGNDPTDNSTDHTREYVPILVYGKKLKKGANIGVRESFSDIGATVADFFGIKLKNGKSFVNLITGKASPP